MHFKLSRALVIAGAIAQTLSGCANIATQRVPRCTGVERRPMNSDLWEWQVTKPAPDLQTSSIKAMGYAPERVPSSIELQLKNVVDAPRWDIAASYERCGEPE